MYKLISSISIIDIVDISIVSFVVYRLFVLVKGTRAMQTLKGFLVLIVLFYISSQYHINTIYWIMRNFWTISLVSFVIIFQPEVRKALAQMGQRKLWIKSFFKSEEEFIQEVVRAVTILAKEKIGALIVFEKNMGLKNYIESGVRLDSRVSVELILTIFHPGTALHDGAIIIRGGQIASACCLLPLSQNPDLPSTLGTRHRAAIGLSEESDALIIIVSEETGYISLTMGGKLMKNIKEETLLEMLSLYTSPFQEEEFKSGS
ncbi:diadenylate cyclase CdaA [bacterium]|nr:diadenylate cyclase CdaA [bacterium]